MRIHKLDTYNKQDVTRFVEFPFRLYRDCPLWVPPLAGEARGQLDRSKHPYFTHSEGDFFLAESEGDALGRIAVLNNRLANQYRGTNTAFFGFFEVIEDRQAALALFDAAFEWARQRGLDRIIGPRGLLGTDGGGILVEGFEHRPALSIPYNFEYYDDFIVAAGFDKDTDHLSGYLPANHPIPERMLSICERVKERRGYWIKTFASKAEMRSWVPRVIAVHRQAFAQTHTFYPPSEAEIQIIANTLIEIAEPRLIKLVMKGEQVAGFIFAYPDFSAGIQKAGGRLWPLGWWHILQERKRTQWVNVNGVGLLPEHQGRGGNTLLYAELSKTVQECGFKHVDIVQVNETNFTSFSDMQTLGVQWYKRHRSYKRCL